MPFDETDLSEWIHNEAIVPRMVIAELEPVKMALHVETAIKTCRKINHSLNQWAELDIVPTKHGQSVSMVVGWVRGGVQQKASEHWRFFLSGGKVSVSTHAVP